MHVICDAQEKLDECSGTISQTSEADFGRSDSFIIRKNASKKYEDSYIVICLTIKGFYADNRKRRRATIQASNSSTVPKLPKPTTYSIYWSPESMSAVDFISKQLKKRVYLIGIRALYEQGVPIYRGTEDIDLYSPISIEERDELGKFLRKRFAGTAEYWRKFGTAFIFPSGDELDINRAVEMHDEKWDKRSIRINNVDVYIPPLEDVVVMKLLAGRPKDMKDIKHVFRTSWSRLDKDRLLREAAKVQADRKLAKLVKVLGYKL